MVLGLPYIRAMTKAQWNEGGYSIATNTSSALQFFHGLLLRRVPTTEGWRNIYTSVDRMLDVFGIFWSEAHLKHHWDHYAVYSAPFPPLHPQSLMTHSITLLFNPQNSIIFRSH